MGPLELQLNRELAIHIVRACARHHQAHGSQADDLDRYRVWFDELYDEWLGSRRPELADRTPAEAILFERQELAAALTPPPSDTTQRVELYTDLPQAENVSDPIEFDPAGVGGAAVADLAPAWERLSERGDGAQLDHRWRAFCDRYLSDWFDEA